MSQFQAVVGKGSPVESIELIPSSGGAFEVTVDGDLVFSKKALKRHAEPGEALRAIVDRQRR